MMMAQCATFLNVSPNRRPYCIHYHNDVLNVVFWPLKIRKKFRPGLHLDLAVARSPIPLVGREGTLSPYLPSTLFVFRSRRPSPLNPNSGDATECPYI